MLSTISLPLFLVFRQNAVQKGVPAERSTRAALPVLVLPPLLGIVVGTTLMRDAEREVQPKPAQNKDQDKAQGNEIFDRALEDNQSVARIPSFIGYTSDEAAQVARAFGLVPAFIESGGGRTVVAQNLRPNSAYKVGEDKTLELQLGRYADLPQIKSRE
jgi:hypothetical protein